MDQTFVRKKIYSIISEQFSVEYVVSQKEDGIVILAMNQGKQVGYLSVNFDMDPSWRIEDEVESDEQISRIFPEGRAAVIEWVKVDSMYLRMGIGRGIIEKALEVIKDEGYHTIYLNASPIGGTIDVRHLKSLYKSFGFKTLFDQGHNVQMIKYL